MIGRNLYRLLLFILLQAVLVVVGMEVVLRLSGRYYTYSEKIFQGYQSYYGKTTNSHYHTYLPRHDFVMDNGDYSYRYITNSIGVREREPSALATDSAWTIVTLGDSFTDGVGAAYDSSWPRVLEKLLQQAGVPALVFNAGTSGSDPFFDERLFTDKLFMYKPQWVIASVNASDFTDFAYRGGEERFLPNGTCRYKQGPWFESIYEHSHIARMVLCELGGYFYGNLFLTKSQFEHNCRQAAIGFADVYIRLDSLCATTNTRLVVVFQPSPGDVESITVSDFSRLVDTGYARLRQHLHTSIPCVDMYQPLRQVMPPAAVQRYSYKNDRHYNGEGYHIYATTLLGELQKRHLLTP
jgi:hypothetical protein